MKKTLIICAYNRAVLLRRILVSIASQSCEFDRIIVADDGSQEDLGEAINQEIHRFSYPITRVTQADSGFRLARSRNNAIRISEDGVLVFIDQDMLFTKGYLNSLIENVGDSNFSAGYLLRLNEEQTKVITDIMVENCDYSKLIRKDQIHIIDHQRKKDYLYEWLYRFHLRPIGPKLVGGTFAVNKNNLMRINGFDEKYEGWGNEDDDLCWRLYASGVTGRNAVSDEYAIHQYHPLFKAVGERANKAYFHKRRAEIMSGGERCANGIINDEADYSDVIVTNYER